MNSLISKLKNSIKRVEASCTPFTYLFVFLPPHVV